MGISESLKRGNVYHVVFPCVRGTPQFFDARSELSPLRRNSPEYRSRSRLNRLHSKPYSSSRVPSILNAFLGHGQLPKDTSSICFERHGTSEQYILELVRQKPNKLSEHRNCQRWHCMESSIQTLDISRMTSIPDHLTPVGRNVHASWGSKLGSQNLLLLR